MDHWTMNYRNIPILPGLICLQIAHKLINDHWMANERRSNICHSNNVSILIPGTYLSHTTVQEETSRAAARMNFTWSQRLRYKYVHHIRSEFRRKVTNLEVEIIQAKVKTKRSIIVFWLSQLGNIGRIWHVARPHVMVLAGISFTTCSFNGAGRYLLT